MEIFDPTIGALNTALNLRQMNQNIIASNVANADTPGYKAKKMEFEGALRQALATGDELKMSTSSGNHLVPDPNSAVHPEIFEDTNGVESLDGNTVDRAAELVAMNENQIAYDTAIELAKKKLGMLRYAAMDGGGNQ